MTYTMRGKEHLVLIRPYSKGLMMHTMYYADEIRSVKIRIDDSMPRPSPPNWILPSD